MEERMNLIVMQEMFQGYLHENDFILDEKLILRIYDEMKGLVNKCEMA